MVFYEGLRAWEAPSVVFHKSLRLWEAHLYVFYVSWRLWEAHLYRKCVKNYEFLAVFSRKQPKH